MYIEKEKGKYQTEKELKQMKNQRELEKGDDEDHEKGKRKKKF